MGLDLKTGTGSGMKALNAHAFQLAVDGLNPFAVLTQVIVVGPLMGLHVLLTDRDEADTGFPKDAGFAQQVIVALVRIDACPAGQFDRQFMKRGQVMTPAWQPVQPPSLELMWTSRTPSPSSSRAHSLWLWQTVRRTRLSALSLSYSSVYTVACGRVNRSTKGQRVPPWVFFMTRIRTWSVWRPQRGSQLYGFLMSIAVVISQHRSCTADNSQGITLCPLSRQQSPFQLCL